ncbi:EAL domain-containing protein [Aestuariibius sp. HNIBRBA575]|uniref:EAL domain-containing protein n=1 Tax=Aestuariibius sp. HNIBRBA575 TaxID=3233343 RepID=UPI0034A32131
MINLTLEDIRYESRFVSRIERRDQPKRLAAAVMMIGICLWSGQVTETVYIFSAIGFSELLSIWIGKRFPKRDDHIPIWLIGILWCNNLFSTVAYLLPTLLLASQPSLALFIAGFLWMCGSLVHIANTFAFLPFFNFSMMTPALLVAFGVLFQLANNTFGVAPTHHWIATAGLLIVYVFNALETLKKQKDTHKQLRNARRESNAQLRKLEYMTQHDGLTGLLNRWAFEEMLQNMIYRSDTESRVAVFILDLDGFKPINDTYTHEAGDHVLRTISTRLQKVIANTGITARLGGDEFAIALSDQNSEDALLKLAHRVAKTIAEPILVKGRELRLTASVGISMSTGIDDSIASLSANADHAMFKAKSARDGQAVMYDPDLFSPRPSLEDRRTLRIAMENLDIKPYYQPKVDIKTGRICGFEALARWEHPERGLLMPGAFLPQVAELSLHGELLALIAETVFSDLEYLLEAGLDPGQVSINVPEVSLATSNGRQELSDILMRYPSILGHVTFEITEDVFIARASETIQESIGHFRANGVRISLDDFGTGFASFQHLRQLDFDELKIDSSFVAALGTEEAADVLVEGFLSIAQGLGVDAIAEGVETAQQEQQLLGMGCTNVQGFLYGRAMPLAETRILLEAEKLRFPMVRQTKVSQTMHSHNRDHIDFKGSKAS